MPIDGDRIPQPGLQVTSLLFKKLFILIFLLLDSTYFVTMELVFKLSVAIQLGNAVSIMGSWASNPTFVWLYPQLIKNIVLFFIWFRNSPGGVTK